MTVIEPASLTLREQTMGNRILWWVLGPVVLVVTLFGVYWVKMSKGESPAQRNETLQAQAANLSEQQKREYVLEIIGLGVTLDKYRQGKLWEALQAGNPHVTIREQDPKKYPWSESDKGGLSGERGGDALENGASFTPMYFAIPVFNAEPEAHNEGRADTPESPTPGLAGGAIGAGMAWHLFVVGPRRFGEQPDRILEDVFDFFDANPDVPYIVLNSEDSLGTRDSNRPPGTPRLLKDGNYVTEKPDASALFVLARRERVDPVRPFVWDDPENDFVQNEFRWMYGNMRASVPNWMRKQALQTPTQIGADMTRQELYNPHGERQPLISEWLEAAAAFTQRPDLRGTGVSGMLATVNPFKHYPPKDWKPTPWFPIPWNREQLETFDRLPTLGYLHRPVFVKFTDEYGKPVTRRAERQKLLQAGWQAALQNLPEARRKDGAARVVVATGGKAAQLIALHGVLDAQAAAGGPEIDSSKSSRFIDTDKRLGDTGAATLFVQMAIGVMGSYRDGGVSAAVNLRGEDEASIVLISPPTDEQRKNQRHPRGGDVFAHRGTPNIDPGNYQ
ncbi:type VI lipase adapter Tla3 domain-containing protein [Massilia sp. BKSP1R2A-1]|uniref:type VI lipase adapter Tla3 domain-containing protein n=1 Tax=Massilia sp. BKSP1R2A-1 TaxID=3422595 RepID=UPI003D34D5C7